MNRELRKVKKWHDANCLALNIDKTNFVIFHSPCTELPDQILQKKDPERKVCHISRCAVR